MGPRDRGPFAGLHSRAVHEGLSVFGVPAGIERNDQAAHDVENSLLPCWGHPDNLTDRWDARLLLDESALSSTHRQWGAREPLEDPDATPEKLDFERFRDLEHAQEEQLQIYGRSSSAAEDSPSSSGSDDYEGALPPPGYAAIPFSYGDTAAAAPGDGSAQQQVGGQQRGNYQAVGLAYDSVAQQQASGGQQQSQQAQQVPVPGPDEPAFVPEFIIPEHLKSSLPATARHFKVIQQTANFVREGGGQLEVLLRVKQAGKPLFGFLLPSDPLHPFYRWLVTTRPEHLVVVNAAPLSGGVAAAAAGGGRARGLERGDGAAQQDSTHGSEREAQHPAEQWRVGRPGQEPAAQEGGQEAQQGQHAELVPAEPAVEYGPALPPPAEREALSSLASLVSQYSDECVKSPKAAALSGGGVEGGSKEGGGQHDQQQQHAQQEQLEGRDAGQLEEAVGVPSGESAEDGAQQVQGVDILEEEGAAGREEIPPDMLAVMQKLVAFVQKNGWRFEGMVRAKESSNPVFGFLHPWHPQHLQYRHMLVKAIGTHETDAILSLIDTATPAHGKAVPETATAHQSGDTSTTVAALHHQAPGRSAPSAKGEAPDGRAADSKHAEQGEPAPGKSLPPWLYSFKVSSLTSAKGNSLLEGERQLGAQPAATGGGARVSQPASSAAAAAVAAAAAAPAVPPVASSAPASSAPGTTGPAGAAASKPCVAVSTAPVAAAARGSLTLPPWLREKMVAAASAAAGAIGEQVATQRGAAGTAGLTAAAGTVMVKLQANPSIAKVSLRLGAVPAASEVGGERVAEGAANAEPQRDAGEGGSQKESSPATVPDVPDQEGQQEGEQGLSTVDPAQGEGAGMNEAEAEERKKAERRRRARELVLQRQQAAALQAAQKRQQQLSAISIHRRAFLDEDKGATELGQEWQAEGATTGPRATDNKAVGEVEEGEITPAAAALKAEGGRPPRHPSGLPLLEDFVTLRMKRASSGEDLAAAVTTPGGGGTSGRSVAAQHGLLPPSGSTIAGHRAAFGEGGVSSGGASSTGKAAATERVSRVLGQGRQQAPAQEAEHGEAALHLRRIRDRIAAMTAGGGAAKGGAGTPSRPGSGLSNASSGPAPSTERQVQALSRGGDSRGSARGDSTNSGGSSGGGQRQRREHNRKGSATQSKGRSGSHSRHSGSRQGRRSHSPSSSSSSGTSSVSGSSRGAGSRSRSRSTSRRAHRSHKKRRREEGSRERSRNRIERKDRKHRRHSSKHRHKH